MESIILNINPQFIGESKSLIIEYLPMVISIYAIWVSYNTHIYANQLNIKTIFYGKIFDEFLLEKIPNSILKVQYLKSMYIDEGDIFESTMEQLYAKIHYFKFRDIKFYDLLIAKIEEIDDFNTKNHKTKMIKANFDNKKTELDKKIIELYQIIEKEYIQKDSFFKKLVLFKNKW